MKSSVFQYIVPAVFGVLGVIGIIYFANHKDTSTENIPEARGNVVIWGAFPNNQELINFFNDFNKQYQKSFSVTYQFHDAKNFDRDIVEALASGVGPDMLLLPDDLILRHSDKITKMTYTPQFGQREYLNTFIQASEIYLRPDGILAFPFAIDPLVMYWNRDIFTNASIPIPPKYWDEFLTMTPRLTQKDRASKITQSAIAFGEFDNVLNAKDILATLFLQAGSPMVTFDKNGSPISALFTELGGTRPGMKAAVESALRFYMDFSNPQKTIFTWSLARSNSEEEFINGNLAVYFDYASKYQVLKQKNPQLNFDVAMMPQLRNATAEITFGKVHGLVVMKTSKNSPTAFAAMRLLLDGKFADEFAKVFSLPPVRRDLLANRPAGAAQAIFYDSALRSRTWLDPKPEDSNSMFKAMIETISSGQNSIIVGLNDAQSRLDALLEPYKKK